MACVARDPFSLRLPSDIASLKLPGNSLPALPPAGNELRMPRNLQTAASVIPAVAPENTASASALDAYPCNRFGRKRGNPLRFSGTGMALEPCIVRTLAACSQV